MTARGLLVVALAACGSHATKAPVPAVPGPGAVAACYGDASYLVRRTYDPPARAIFERRVGSNGAADVIMDVTLGEVDTFTIRGGPAGTGQLDGPDWAWTSWNGQFHVADSTMTTATTLDATGMHTQSEIHAGGSHSMGAPEDYPAFPCEEFAARARVISGAAPR